MMGDLYHTESQRAYACIAGGGALPAEKLVGNDDRGRERSADCKRWINQFTKAAMSSA
jgi:hypothetical protein